MQDFGGKSAYAGREPFDERLLALRYWKNKGRLLAIVLSATIVLTALIVLGRFLSYLGSDYRVVQYYHFDYVVEPINTGDTSIIYQTWETYTTTRDFLELEADYVSELSGGSYRLEPEEILGMTSMTLPTDIHVPCSTVVAKDPELARILAQAFNRALLEYVIPMLSPQIMNFQSMNTALEPEKIAFDARFPQALGLSLVTSLVLTLVIYGVWELGLDSIYLPSDLRRRYGLPGLGAMGDDLFFANLEHLESKWGDEKAIAICPVDENVDPLEIKKFLEERGERKYVAIPAPMLSRNVAQTLQGMEHILLAVPAGEHSGKTLERVLDFFAAQDLVVDGAFLVGEDEELIKRYYRIAQTDENTVDM